MGMSPEEIYKRQNMALHKGMASLGIPYDENKAIWVTQWRDAFGRQNIKGMSDLTLGERRNIIRFLNKNVGGLFNPIFHPKHDDWTKKDARKFAAKPGKKKAEPVGDHAKRPVRVPVEKRPYVEKLGAILADMDLPWSYADAIAKERFDVQVVEWLEEDELKKVMQMLIIHQKRKKGTGRAQR